MPFRGSLGRSLVFKFLIEDHVRNFVPHVELKRVVKFRVEADGAAVGFQKRLAINQPWENKFGAEVVGDWCVIILQE